jgi:hypothetical protein
VVGLVKKRNNTINCIGLKSGALSEIAGLILAAITKELFDSAGT